MTLSRFGIACIAVLSGAACTDLDSATNLNPEGPPMIRQVRMKEVYQDASGAYNDRLAPVFAFGTHPQVTSEDQAHPVTSAKAVSNKLRIILDELLIGNYLEEIACRAPIDNDAYDTVPLGATPDDIARCSVAKDVLPGSCPGTNTMSVCICKLDTGCGEAAKGMPVGVLDVNQDGAADDTRFMAGAAGIRCGSIDVPVDVQTSYWNPSGDQNVPAMGGFDALGPALVIQPAPPPGAPMGTPAFLPTNTTCGLVFAPDVTDKQNNQICAPPDGDVTKNCTAGDVSAFSFKVEPLRAENNSFVSGDTGISRTDQVQLKVSAPVAASTLTAITVLEGTTPYTQFTVTQPFPDTLRITWTATGGLAANQMYTIRIGTGLTDLFNQPVPQETVYTFTTGS